MKGARNEHTSTGVEPELAPLTGGDVAGGMMRSYSRIDRAPICGAVAGRDRVTGLGTGLRGGTGLRRGGGAGPGPGRV